MMAGLSAQARAVIGAIEAGRAFRRRGAGWAAGSLRATDSLVAELERRGHVRRDGDGLALARPPAANRSLVANRLLVERALPQDAPVAAPGRTARPARSVTVNLAESPLGWLRARGLIDERRFEAGERLRGDWTVAGLGPRTTMRWDAGAPTTGERLDPTLAQISARRRVDAAFDAVGPGLRDVLWRIVCAGEGMETAEGALGWPARSGRVVLLIALERLADFYRLP